MIASEQLCVFIKAVHCTHWRNRRAVALYEALPETFTQVNPLTAYANSNLIYRVKWGCSAIYMGRMEQYLNLREAEHIPAGRNRQQTRTQSAMKQRSIERRTSAPKVDVIWLTRHTIDNTKVFEIVFTAHHWQVLQFAEAIEIGRCKPKICQQKELFVSTCLLCWGSEHDVHVL